MNEFQKRIISSVVIMPLSLFFIIKGSILFYSFLLTCFLLSSYEWNKMAQNKLIFIFGLVFLLISFYCAYMIRETSNEKGLYTLLFLIIISISTDIGGYIFGKSLKGPKLTKISPNKTYAGMIGSFITAIVIGILFIKYSNYINVYKIELNQNIIYLIFSLSLVSQIGDLVVSYFKRFSKLDNTSNLIPGHGGILDRIDGMIFVIPLFYLFNSFFKII